MEWDGCVLLLLSVMLLTGQGSAQGSELSFTIDHVSLSVLPGPDVRTGTNVTLRCQVQVSHSAEWLMHSFSFLLEAVEVHAHNSTDSQSDYSLLPARAAHSGAYSCRVRVLEKERSSPDTQLNVSGLTTPMLTVDSAVIYEGQEAKVTCLAPDEVGSLKFQLEVNGERKRDFTNTQNPVSLKMNTPGRMTLRCRMRLLLKPEAGETISNIVTITVKELMVTPTVTFEPESGVVEGDFLMVRCSVPTFSELPPVERSRLEIFLTKDGRVLRQLTGKAVVPHQLRAVASDAGTYVCKTEMQGGSLQKTASGTIAVTELFSAPEVSVRPLVVYEGDNFTVSCSVRRLVASREAVLRYRLFHQGALLHIGQHYTATATATAHTDGQYFCQAEAKEILRNSTALRVTAKILASRPVISTNGGVIIGRPFQVGCRSDRGSLPVIFTLMKGQRSLGSQEVNALSALFNVSASAVRDGAELAQLYCRAANHPDRTPLQSLPLQAGVIVPISNASLTLEPFGGGITEGSDLRLTCTALKGSAPFTFTFTYSGHQGATVERLLETVTHGNRATHTLRGIQRAQAGEYQCNVRNPANQRSSKVKHVHVKLAAWKVALLTVCVILLVAGIGVTLLILIKKTNPCTHTHTGRAGEISVKPAKSRANDPQRVSLVLEEQPPPNATPGMLGRSVWSEHISGSDSESQSEEEHSVEVQYPQEIHPPPIEMPLETTELPNGSDNGHNDSEVVDTALTNGTDAAPNEEQVALADHSAQTEGVSMEYVQMYCNDAAPE